MRAQKKRPRHLPPFTFARGAQRISTEALSHSPDTFFHRFVRSTLRFLQMRYDPLASKMVLRANIGRGNERVFRRCSLRWWLVGHQAPYTDSQRNARQTLRKEGKKRGLFSIYGGRFNWAPLRMLAIKTSMILKWGNAEAKRQTSANWKKSRWIFFACYFLGECGQPTTIVFNLAGLGAAVTIWGQWKWLWMRLREFIERLIRL